jgi:putative transposase
MVAQTFLSVPDADMSEPRLRIRRRNLPHWTLEGSTYFVTFRVAKGHLAENERRIVLDHIISGDGRFYIIGAAVVMPDHVHVLIRPLQGYDLSRIMKGIKGVSARKINASRGTKGTVWQDESWDRIVRDAEEFQEKLQYMANNRRKAELARSMDEYPYWYCNREFV